ncbi:hypothetical protein HYQ45_002013 [Verticillium longisporum]|uniref:Uncharacterized protein n=1 Tax=Verticillium longisporum TaxID=100787 RepID=A0A0G4LAM3_VERLO|nr:hypothetical protein HYQ44_014340 [Verticillium longisporum]KAG7141363.1 hypothetical protein HYQ45_002013 [Verticillium longisporum]CRK19057.1 hypothetical protein BN1708_012510 [Verticillium longisporum]CRK35384.1 hypothetical protein BN1723_004134 [Verticillium longisporum]
MVVALLTDAANRAIDIANTLEPLQRMGFLWTWCLGGILFAVQMSQIGETTQWTKLTREQTPYWLTFYGFQFVMLTFGAFPVFRDRLDGLCFGYEENVLNGILIGIITLEAALVFYATLHFLTRGGRVAAQPKKA